MATKSFLPLIYNQNLLHPSGSIMSTLDNTTTVVCWLRYSNCFETALPAPTLSLLLSITHRAAKVTFHNTKEMQFFAFNAPVVIAYLK